MRIVTALVLLLLACGPTLAAETPEALGPKNDRTPIPTRADLYDLLRIYQRFVEDATFPDTPVWGVRMNQRITALSILIELDGDDPDVPVEAAKYARGLLLWQNAVLTVDPDRINELEEIDVDLCLDATEFRDLYWLNEKMTAVDGGVTP